MAILYNKHNYINKNVRTIRGAYIREYDIKSAGLNIIYNKKLITEDEYKQLMSMEKLKRNIVIGKWLQKNPEVNQIMMNEFIRIRKMFFEANNLSDDDILSIKKDAIIVINKKLTKLKFENYEFVLKEEYTDFLLLDRVEYYYNKYTKKLDVKGLPKEVKAFQEDVYFSLIKEIFQTTNKNDMYKKFLIFKDDFIEFKLPKEYYKDIYENVYIFKFSNMYRGLDNIEDYMIKEVDISRNLTFINNLITIFI